MAPAGLSVPALYAALDAVREDRGLSWRQLAREVGVSPSTFSRMANGHKPDVDAFVAMVRWLKVPAERFVIGGEPDGGESGLMAALVPVLYARRDLSSEDKLFIQALVGAAVRRFGAERHDPTEEG